MNDYHYLVCYMRKSNLSEFFKGHFGLERNEYKTLACTVTDNGLILACLLHSCSMCAFAGQLSPTNDGSGIVEVVADTFRLRRFRTPTGEFVNTASYCVILIIPFQPIGMQFIATADVRHGSMDAFLRRAYQIYADYALKNPFYTVDMPIR